MPPANASDCIIVLFPGGGDSVCLSKVIVAASCRGAASMILFVAWASVMLLRILRGSHSRFARSKSSRKPQFLFGSVD